MLLLAILSFWAGAHIASAGIFDKPSSKLWFPWVDGNCSIYMPLSLAAMTEAVPWGPWKVGYNRANGTNETLAEKAYLYGSPLSWVMNDTSGEGQWETAPLRIWGGSKVLSVFCDTVNQSTSPPAQVIFRGGGSKAEIDVDLSPESGTSEGAWGWNEFDRFTYGSVRLDISGQAQVVFASPERFEPPAVHDLYVHFGIETNVSSMEEVRNQTWYFATNGTLDKTPGRFTFSDPEDESKWTTTSAYARSVGDDSLGRLMTHGRDGAVMHPGAKVTFKVPAKTSWIELNVTRGPAFGALRIESNRRIEGYAATLAEGFPDDTLWSGGEQYVADERVWIRSLNPHVPFKFTLSAVTVEGEFGGKQLGSKPVALRSVMFMEGEPIPRFSKQMVIVLKACLIALGALLALVPLIYAGRWLRDRILYRERKSGDSPDQEGAPADEPDAKRSSAELEALIPAESAREGEAGIRS